MWLMKTLLTSGCTNQRGAGQGQFSRILGRRKFLETHRSRLLELLQWPQHESVPLRNIELYVSRDVYYWMVHPPYPVPTQFVRVDTLDTWIKTELNIP